MVNGSIRRRIFTNNLLLILMMLTLTAVIFNLAAGRYFQRSAEIRLERAANEVADLALLKGPEFFPPRPPEPFALQPPPGAVQESAQFYLLLEQVLHGPGTSREMDYLLLDSNGECFDMPERRSEGISEAVRDRLQTLVLTAGEARAAAFDLEGARYVAAIRPVSDRNAFGLGWVVLYSDMAQAEAVQRGINFLLLAILGFSALVTAVFSAQAADKVCRPFSELDRHLQALGDHRYGQQLELSVDQELQELVATVNRLSNQLDLHDQAQKTFLQNISHDFRTPLMAIQSHAEGIRHRVVTPERAVTVILEEVSRLTGLVENLLYLSRLEALTETVALAPVALQPLAEACVERFLPLAAQEGMALRLKATPEPLWVSGDREKLTRALENLLSNGVRYGETMVTVSLEAAGDQVLLTVTDDGQGILEAELPRIFDRFYRGPDGRFGLGLAIVQSVAEGHGAHVDVRCDADGTHFILVFKKMKQLEETDESD